MSVRAKENAIAIDIVGVAHQIHSALGPGLMETVYQPILAHEIKRLGYRVKTHVPIPVIYSGMVFNIGFFADIVVEDLVLVDVRSVDELILAHKTQAKTFVRLASKRLGLLINFGATRFKEGLLRIVNDE